MVHTWSFQSISSLSSSDFTSCSPSVPQEMLNFARQFSGSMTKNLFSALHPNCQMLELFPYPLHGCSPAADSVAMASKQSRCLFPLALPEVQLLFEGSHQTRVASEKVQYYYQCKYTADRLVQQVEQTHFSDWHLKSCCWAPHRYFCRLWIHPPACTMQLVSFPGWSVGGPTQLMHMYVMSQMLVLNCWIPLKVLP